MAGTGKVIALIKALGGSGASPEEIKAAVAEWLAEHVDPDTGYVIDDTFSIPGAAPDAKLTGDELNSLKSAISDMVVETTNEYKPSITNHETALINADGSISAGTTASQNVYEIHLSGDSKFRMTADSYGGASGARYAFYTATTYAECGTETVISVNAYERNLSNIYDYTIPANAKMLLIYYKTMKHLSCVKTSENIVGYSSLSNEYDSEKTYKVGDVVTHEGFTYICIELIANGETWTASHWVRTTIMSQIDKIHAAVADFSERAEFQVGSINTQTGEIQTGTSSTDHYVSTKTIIHVTEMTPCYVASGYEAAVVYYEADGTYAGVYHNLADTSLYRHIVPADSYVRFTITRANDTSVLTSMDIPEFIDKITYVSDYANLVSEVNEAKVNASNGMAARMYEKGASPKSFANAPCILCAGQSNIAGVIDHDDIPDTIQFPMQNIMFSPSNKPNSFDNGITSIGSWGVDLSLYDKLNGLDMTTYVIKFAVAGTGIDEQSSSAANERWTAFYERLSDLDKSLLYKLETKIRTLGAANPNAYDVRALIWHQGENDSKFSNSGNPYIPARYYENFKNVIEYIRGVVGNERLPVIYGTISHDSIGYDPVVEAAQLRIAEEDPNCYCIDMSGATLFDEYHFDANSAVYFGEKAFDALIDFGVISGTKINPTPPWEE